MVTLTGRSVQLAHFGRSALVKVRAVWSVHNHVVNGTFLCLQENPPSVPPTLAVVIV